MRRAGRHERRDERWSAHCALFIRGSRASALSVDTGAAIADPFEHTAAIVDSLRAQARDSRAPRPAILPGHLGRALFGRA